MIAVNEKKLREKTEYLYDEAIEALENGVLASRPVDDMAILAYGITKEEMEPYMNSKYLNTHWSDILDLILDARDSKK